MARPSVRIPSRPSPPKVDAVQAIAAIKDRLSLLTPAQRESYLAPILAALDALRRDRGRQESVMNLADGLQIAAELCKQRIAADRESEIAAGLQAVAELVQRGSATRRWTLLAGERAAIEEALFFHKVQIHHCTNGELDKAVMAVVERTRQALRGHHAAGALVIDPLAQQANVNEAAALHAASTRAHHEH